MRCTQNFQFAVILLSVLTSIGCWELETRIAIDAPVVEMKGTPESHGDEPYFMAFQWEATSKNAETGEVGRASSNFNSTDGTIDVRALGESFNYTSRGGTALLGEDLTSARFDFGIAPQTAAEARNMHVGIGGLTVCAFEQDRTGGSVTYESILLNFRQKLDRALGVYKNSEFTDQNVAEAFAAMFDGLLAEIDREFATKTPAEQEQKQSVLDELKGVIEPLQDLIGNVTDGASSTKRVTKALNPVQIGQIVGTAFKIIPNIISLFKKGPDPDDFIGCGSVVVAGVPHALWNSFVSSNTAGCYGGPRALTMCAFDQVPDSETQDPPGIRFAPPKDAEHVNPNLGWTAWLNLRSGVRTFWGSHKTIAVGQRKRVTRDAPRNPGYYGNDEHWVSFAHVLEVRSLGSHEISYEIVPKDDPEVDIEPRYEMAHTNGRSDASVAARLSRASLPDWMTVRRQTQEIGWTQTGYLLWWDSPGTECVNIPEVLALTQAGQGALFSTFPARIAFLDLGPSTIVWIRNALATVRSTRICWPEEKSVQVRRTQVTATDWQPQSAVLQEISPNGFTLAYPREIDEGHAGMGYAIRLDGGDVDNTSNWSFQPRPRIYAEVQYPPGRVTAEALHISWTN